MTMPKHSTHNAHAAAPSDSDTGRLSAFPPTDALDALGPHASPQASSCSDCPDSARHTAPPTTRTTRSMRRQAAREARARRKHIRLLRKNKRNDARKHRKAHPDPQHLTSVHTTETHTVSTRTTSVSTTSTGTEESVQERTNTTTRSTFTLEPDASKRGWLRHELDTVSAPKNSADLDLFSRTIARLASQALAWMRPTTAAHSSAAQPLFGFIHQDVVHQFQEAPILGLTRLVSHHSSSLSRREFPSEHPPLILIHGLAGSPGNFAPIRVWLSQHRPRPVHVFDYRDHGDMFPAAEAFGQWLDELITLYDDDTTFEILAHSMGGLVTRLALRNAKRAARISHLLTLGTPHQGTRLATLGASTYLRQLQVDSPVFQALNASEASPLPYALTSIWTQRDILVLPSQHATLPGYASYAMHQSTHLSWLLHPQLIDDVFNILDAERVAHAKVERP